MLEEHMDSHDSEGISLVVPRTTKPAISFNHACCICQLKALGRPWEIIVVNDGSDDQTSIRVKEWMKEVPNVNWLSIDGIKGTAPHCGWFSTAQFALICFTDADRQFELADLRTLLGRIHECHLVAGVRSPRQDPWHRRLLGRLWTQDGPCLQCWRSRFKLCVQTGSKEALSSFQLHSTGGFINGNRDSTPGTRL